MSECDHPWTSEDGCWICDLEEIIDRQKETISAVTAERDALQTTLEIMRSESTQADRYASENDGELSELRARVERAKALVAEYDEGDYFVHGKIQPSFYEGVDWAHKNLLAILEGDEK